MNILPPLNNFKEKFLANKFTAILIFAAIIILVIGFFAFKTLTATKELQLLSDIELSFDPEGPFAILTPRKDGNALVLNIKRIASYDAFSYTITYTDETGIDRGAGDLNTWIDIKNKRSDYEQEILFGTCSKGATEDPRHCVFDKGVENGTLVLRIRKATQPYKMGIQWHLQKPDLALGQLSSGDGHFTYTTTNDRTALSLTAFTIINDLTGAPKLPENLAVQGKVYALNTPTARTVPAGAVSMELPENPPAEAKIGRYSEKDNKWEELETKISGSKLESSASGAGIFAVLTTK